MAQVFKAFHNKLMSPLVDLNQTDINSLDGSPQTQQLRERIDKILKL